MLVDVDRQDACRSWTGSVKRFSEPLHTVWTSACQRRVRSAGASARHRTTIRELAEYTGLSPAAVSYALRGMQVSAETERRVREAAEELGYEADPIARALAGGATGVVGLLVGSLGDFWNQELVRAVQRELYGAAPQHARGRRRRRARARARARAAARRPARRRARRRADRPGQRRLGVDRPAGRDGHDRRRAAGRRRRPARWSSTTSAASSRASQHLSALGHRRVTVLSWAVETSPGREAERAVAGSAAALGLDCSVVAVRVLAQRLAPARARAARAAPSARRAVLCMSDSIAYGVYAACAELGLSIPGDVAVAGFGDHPISRLLSPPLTSTVWDVEQVAERATGFLLDGDRRRRPAGDAARGRRAGARRARVDRGRGQDRRPEYVVRTATADTLPSRP